MALPVPNLDDRRFQDLVDDAKRLVQQRCPEWTDHNVSDPGVTLIEMFAWMTDQLLYRLNRVPDRNYVKFLELIGVRLFPPTAARGEVTFWLSAPQPDAVRIAGGTQVATSAPRPTRRSSSRPSTTSRSSRCTLGPRARPRPTARSTCDRTTEADERPRLRRLRGAARAGDLLLVGLSEAAPSNAVRLDFRCTIEGVGVDPTCRRWPGRRGRATAGRPASWTATPPAASTATATSSSTCRAGHAASVVEKLRAGWLRARVTEPEEGQPFYSASPSVRGVTAFTVGGTAAAVNAEVVVDEILGVSEGVPGQRFLLKRRPVVPGDRPTSVQVSDDEDGWQEWTQVPDFAGSGPEDRHFVLDAVAGEVRFGPAVREPDGSVRGLRRGAAEGTPHQLASTAPAAAGSATSRRASISVLKSSIPFVSRVENRRAEAGGVDGEDIENAKVRGPIPLRTRGRAVTTEDFEHLAREAAPELARVRAVGAGDGADAGSVRVLVVPAAQADDGRLRFEQLVPPDDTLARVADRLDETRVIGTRVIVEPPVYRGITVVARLRPRRGSTPARLQEDALRALYAYFHPITGGPDGTGWPFGRPVQMRRGLLRPPAPARHRARRGRAPVRGRPDHRPARPGDAAPRARAARARVQLRAPAPGRGGLAMRGDAPRAGRAPTRSASTFPASTGTTTSPSGSRRRSTRSWPGRSRCSTTSRPTWTRRSPRRTSWSGSGAGSARRPTRRGRSSGAGRSWPPPPSCSGCAGPPPGWPPTSPSSRAARSRSPSTARRAGRATPARPCRRAPRPTSSSASGCRTRRPSTARLEALVAASKPAHVPHRVEIVKA